MSDARFAGYVSAPGPVSGAKLAAEWLAAHDKVTHPVGYGVHNIVRLADELGVSREQAIADFIRIVDEEEMATRPASLQDIVLLALSQGVIFDSATQAFLLDLCERLDGEARVDMPASASRLTGELMELGRILNAMMLSGAHAGDDAELSAQVWRIEAITTYERQLASLSHQAAARATVLRRHGLRYFEDTDMKALTKAMSEARDIGEPGQQISRNAWTAVARGVAACFWVARDERVFMLDQLASFLLEEAGFTLTREARAVVQAVANGETEPVAA